MSNPSAVFLFTPPFSSPPFSKGGWGGFRTPAPPSNPRHLLKIPPGFPSRKGGEKGGVFFQAAVPSGQIPPGPPFTKGGEEGGSEEERVS